MDPSATVTVPVEEESALESQEDAEHEKNRALFFAAGHIGEDPKGGEIPGPTFARKKPTEEVMISKDSNRT